MVYDASAGVIAACGMLELARAVPAEEARVYQRAAIRLLRAIEDRFCNWAPEIDGIVYGGSVNYKEEEGRDRYLVYSDFFFVQALLMLLGSELEIW